MTFLASPQQQAFFNELRHGTSSLVLEARAGCGKTTAIVKGAEELEPTARVVMLAYNSKIAKELKERTGHLSNVQAMTCHSAGFRALQNAVPGLRNPDPKKMEKLGEHYCRTEGRLDLEPIIKAMCKTVGMAKQLGIGALDEQPNKLDNWLAMVEHHDLADDMPGMEEAQDEGDEEWIAAQKKKLVGWSMHMLKRSNVAVGQDRMYDFDDMIYMPLLLNLRFFKNDVVFLDEAQDTNGTRRALAKRMVKAGGRLVAVGDRYQAIYGFSGADNDSLDQIVRDTGAKTLPLSVTYRCPKAVVRIAQVWVPDIQAHESAPEGEYREIEYKDILDHLQSGDAILCRYNRPLVGLCFRLLRAGRAARIEGRAIGQGLVAIARKWKCSDTTTLAKRISDWKAREMAKAEKEGKENRALMVEDQAETMFILIERCLEEGIRTVQGLCDKITSLFDDNVVDRADMITLCSVHRSKGLEFPRVFVLGLYELMGRIAKQDWQTAQEMHLQYVAATRAQSLLVNVTGVKEEAKQHNQEAQ